jgi:multiple sugar transport system permease protein
MIAHQKNNIVTNTKRKHFFQIDMAKLRAILPNQIAAYLFLLPALIVFSVFAWLPMLKSIHMSFQKAIPGTQETTWANFDNFTLMFKDPAFGIAWRNTLEFTTWSLLLGFIFPVILAVFVAEMRVGKGFFRVVYFLPTVVPTAIAIIIWRFLYDPDGGYLNALLGHFNIAPQLWIKDPNLVKPSLIMMMTWSGFGTTALIYLASLQDISTDLYEAAELDGATPMQRIKNISLPHLYPVMSMMFVLQIIAVVQVFTEPFLMTTGGPGRNTLTPALHIYNRSFLRNDMNYASAWSVTMILVLGAFSIIYRIVNHRLTHND